MNILPVLVAITANVLGIFNDPFEFDGDYGPEVNPLRQKVFERVLKENQYDPTLSQVVTPEILTELKKKPLDADNLKQILVFIEANKDQKMYRFLRSAPKEMMQLDKVLRDKAAREGQALTVPILGSTAPIVGKSAFERKKALLDALFTEETAALATSQQIFFYWLYQATTLDLISQEPDLCDDVNRVKEIFAKTIGDSQARAISFKEKVQEFDACVLFTQECDGLTADILTNDGLFLPTNGQNPLDGTFIFLKRDIWEPNYQVLSIDNYEGAKAGRINVILATVKATQQQFLLASCHGHSTRSVDGRLQIALVMDLYKSLGISGLQLIIGIDANTKSSEDVALLHAHLNSLGLEATKTGPTTVKRRMCTTQHAKAGRFAVDEEDFLITLSAESGGDYYLSNVIVGFLPPPADQKTALPNLANPSDHYPVGARLTASS